MRYPPIPREDWTEEQASVAKAILDGPRGELRGPFVPLLHAPKLAGKVQELGEIVRFHTGFSNALLEIAVLVTARHNDCPNIWESHTKLATTAGLAREIIAGIAERRTPSDMTSDEALIYAFATELMGGNKVSDATFASASARWGRKGVMELAGICGYYALLATILNAAERPLLDPNSTPFAIP